MAISTRVTWTLPDKLQNRDPKSQSVQWRHLASVPDDANFLHTATQTVIDGSVGQVLRQIDEKLASHNRVAVDLLHGPTEVRHSQYPRVAIQQLVYNAVLHRSYEAMNAPVRVTWFDDRIEIQSPGGPFGMVTAENFGTPGITDYRNPHLAEALRVLGPVHGLALGWRQRNGHLSKTVILPSGVSSTLPLCSSPFEQGLNCHEQVRLTIVVRRVRLSLLGFEFEWRCDGC